jgi:hypothetical protein
MTSLSELQVFTTFKTHDLGRFLHHRGDASAKLEVVKKIFCHHGIEFDTPTRQNKLKFENNLKKLRKAFTDLLKKVNSQRKTPSASVFYSKTLYPWIPIKTAHIEDVTSDVALDMDIDSEYEAMDEDKTDDDEYEDCEDEDQVPKASGDTQKVVKQFVHLAIRQQLRRTKKLYKACVDFSVLNGISMDYLLGLFGRHYYNM